MVWRHAPPVPTGSDDDVALLRLLLPHDLPDHAVNQVCKLRSWVRDEAGVPFRVVAAEPPPTAVSFFWPDECLQSGLTACGDLKQRKKPSLIANPRQQRRSGRAFKPCALTDFSVSHQVNRYWMGLPEHRTPVLEFCQENSSYSHTHIELWITPCHGAELHGTRVLCNIVNVTL